jgi:nucleoside-diphosphate-sugar epimerase
VLHLAAILSAAGERDPGLALSVNTLGAQNVLSLAAERRLQARARWVFAEAVLNCWAPAPAAIFCSQHTHSLRARPP